MRHRVRHHHGFRPLRGRLAAGLALLVACAPALAQGALPQAAPLPFARPDRPAGSAIDRALTTGTVAPAPAAPTAVSDPLATALDALAGGDAGTAIAARNGLPQGSLDRDILTWAIATSGAASVPSREIALTARGLRGWPGAAALRENSERAMLREDPPAATVLRAFGETRPRTPEGTIVLARAHLAAGDAARARAVLEPVWRSARLDARAEQAIIAEFAALLPRAAHRERMERMLYADRLSSARRVARLAGAQELSEAFAAVSRNDGAAAARLAAVPEEQRAAAYLFAKSRHLRRTGKYREAAAVMMQAPRDAAALVDPDAWWVERRVLSRELIDLDDAVTAYRLAAAHAAESPVMAADAEFHAGWYALRWLGDAAAAARHFARIVEIAEGPITLSRGHYWLARAIEAGAEGDAEAEYAKAAEHGTAFYGQLAAAKLGRDLIAAAAPEPAGADRARFEQRPAVRAIRRLQELGQSRLADRLCQSLAQDLASPGELALLAALVEGRGNHFLALRIAKAAASRGVGVGALTHPTGAIPAEADIAGAGLALAYAIARQESEFNVAARSGAGALGLLQLMPATAREMAGKAGLAYAPARLTTDAAYNATLGSRFLDEQLARFAGSYLLTFAGYNAGPRRAQDWIARYGDPRGRAIDDVVDWIERIPFTETRSYVQRVMENYQVYKMRLTGRMEIEDDLVNGRRP